jgi:hypothetical protein
LALANSLYGSGVYLGGALASLSILLDTNYGWCNTLLIIAAYGAFSAILTSILLPNVAATTTTPPLVVVVNTNDDTNDDNNNDDNDNAESSFWKNAGLVLESTQVRWIYE